jgi:hypothetical protein
MSTLRIAIVSFLLAVLTCGIVSLVMVGQLKDFHEQRDAAMAKAKGTIVEDGIGDEGSIRVRWQDSAGTSHTTKFGIYDTDRYVKGQAFTVRFDSAHPEDRVFPADPEETSQEEDIYAGIFLPWILVVVAGAWWLVRAVRIALSRRTPAAPARMKVVSGFSLTSSPVTGMLRTTWVTLERGKAKEFQRVGWHPALSTIHALEQVQTFSGGGSTTVQLGDGARLGPIGRTRDQPPKLTQLRPIPAVRSSQADSFLQRPVEAHDAWLRTILMRAAYGATIGCLPGILFGGTQLIWVGALLGAAGAVNLWALYGADR